MKKVSTYTNHIKNTAFYVISVGLMFITIALVAAFFPQVITLFFVSIFVFIGLITTLIGFKIYNIYKSVDSLAKKIKIDKF